MREILFRGKRLDNGEWVCGFIVKMFGTYHIIDKEKMMKILLMKLSHPLSASTSALKTRTARGFLKMGI